MELFNHLFFTTDCEPALAFYTRCGLGHVVEMKRYGSDAGSDNGRSMQGRVLHSRFEGPGVVFFASDSDDAEPMRGSAHLLMMDDPDQTARLFGLLAEERGVTTPLGLPPWGASYGKLTDRFGVQWMLNCPCA